MASKIFISILGTSPYIETRYYFGDKPTNKEKPMRFVQEATVGYVCKDWSKDDKVRIFLTDGARESNWIDNGNKEPYEGLQTRLKKMNLNFDLKAIPIKEGFSEDEIWNIFETVFKEIDDDSEIYFDITHAFRSIPMLVMVLINYSKFLKNVKVKGIYYGVFEKLGLAYEVKKIHIAKRFAPIINLNAFSVLQDWTSAASDFVSFGNADKLSELTKQGIRPFAAQYKGSNDTINGLNNVIKKLPEFISNIQTCRSKSIIANFEGALINESLSLINDDFISPLMPILKKIEQKVYAFKNKDNLINGFNAVKWCIDNNLIQQGFTILQENIISLILEELELDVNSLMDRNIVSSCFKIKMDNISQDKWIGDASSHPDKAQNVLDKSILISILYKDYNAITDLRNDINHAGYNNQPVSSKKFKGYLQDRYCSVLSKIELSC